VCLRKPLKIEHASILILRCLSLLIDILLGLYIGSSFDILNMSTTHSEATAGSCDNGDGKPSKQSFVFTEAQLQKARRRPEWTEFEWQEYVKDFADGVEYNLMRPHGPEMTNRILYAVSKFNAANPGVNMSIDEGGQTVSFNM
jgi:hypothetical protein